MPLKVFGKKPSGNRLKRIMASPNYKDGAFQNLEHTEVMRQGASFWGITKEMINRPKTITPSKPMPSVKTNLRDLTDETPTVVWFGHSSYFIKSKGFTILVDPVFSGNASPVSFFGKAFKGADVYNVEDFPAIDILLITHDHYDHLDYKTVTKLIPKTKKVVTSLGVGEHLEYWGFNPAIITELDWWESTTITTEINLTATPARHFSGRGIKRATSLWSSFVLNLNGYCLFLGGDSGYGTHFKTIGEKFGPFDLAILENGQYGHNWPNIHTMPEETVLAAQDLKASIVLPVHWGKFVLSIHPWNEPIKRFVTAANKAQLAFVAPQIGEPYKIGEKVISENWWEFE